MKVHITFLEESVIHKTKSNGKKMAEALKKIAQNNALDEIDAQKWQQEIRQDRSLPNRD